MRYGASTGIMLVTSALLALSDWLLGRRPIVSVLSFCAPRLCDDQVGRWRDFNSRCSSAKYTQDPAWAAVEQHYGDLGGRRPYFFWCEKNGDVCLTAIGVRRRLPLPGYANWEFENGPNVLDPAVLDEWLGWLPDAIGRRTARVLMQPAALLDAAGDMMETVLDARGFVRRRAFGVWSTLVIDLDRPEEQILGSFRPKTRRTIRRAEEEGVVVSVEDTPEGWAALVALGEEAAARTPVQPIDRHLVEAISRHWFHGGSRGTVLVARHQGEPVAAKLLIVYGSKATGRWMPSSRRHTRIPTSHVLTWEAMRYARAHGCTEYDHGGYSLSARPGEPLWHVNTFKRGFAPGQDPWKYVAVHERVLLPVVVESAAAVRRVQTSMRLRAGQRLRRADYGDRGGTTQD